ncbi:MAG TPA: oligosaccharide flippase family protein [Patescibacteria group bacterium]|nr:oligosaccharide flippase family protein [Patescibacteria group bacterium]
MGYTKDVIKGVSWTGLLSFSTKLVGFIEALILARILLPSQFGAYGIAMLALGLLETLTETGVNIVLVQEKETERYISSAWIVSIARGLIIMLVLLAVSPFIANFFHSPGSLILLLLISIVPFFRGFINPSVVKFQKELNFRKNFWYQMIILFVNTAISITITFMTKQPIGIIIGLLAGVITELFLSFIVVSPRPRIQFEKEYIFKIFHRGKWITLGGIFDYLFYNSDNIAVGRILGATSLGIYQLAYSLAVMPLVEISNVFIYVTFPIFTKLSNDRPRLKNAYFKTVLGICLLAIPFVLVFIIFPQIFVYILGQKWSAITSILPVLALLGFVKAISGSSSALFLSELKQKYVMSITLITIVGMLLALVPLINRYGMIGAGEAALIGSVIPLPVIIYFIWKIFRNKNNTRI